MEKPVEFSKFYRLLNAVKEGDNAKLKGLDDVLDEYKSSEKSPGPLHQLGETFIYRGILELYEYAGSKDIRLIGQIEKEEWEELAEKNKGDLPPHLANTMIKYAKDSNLSKQISERWDISKRQIDQNIMQMARYVTEGIIDALE